MTTINPITAPKRNTIKIMVNSINFLQYFNYSEEVLFSSYPN